MEGVESPALFCSGWRIRCSDCRNHYADGWTKRRLALPVLPQSAGRDFTSCAPRFASLVLGVTFRKKQGVQQCFQSTTCSASPPHDHNLPSNLWIRQGQPKHPCLMRETISTAEADPGCALKGPP